MEWGFGFYTFMFSDAFQLDSSQSILTRFSFKKFS